MRHDEGVYHSEHLRLGLHDRDSRDHGIPVTA
jgi:hypothetical protein